MADWAPIVIGLILFVLFSPGLLFQLPGKGRVVEFVNFQTSAISIFVHSLLFFGFMVIFIVAIDVHIYSG
ncbi:hypothetical protein MtrunA17_Chr7g0225011 [Medicago truncatula]|uniref:Transmembrane protein n=1 Tax=Medicago truncatula TaxID=3880 RepID=A0A396GZS7_MEDTR|nr:uncharacterized protein LOC25497783 [Medicago truncatula]RHN44954.1 hypothetical protein MtrunA17_Chr7g0225011 [Medicago truncatula]